MNQKVEEISINEISYVPKSQVNKMADDLDGMKYVIARTNTAGVFAGYLKSRNGQEVVLLKARRIWYWDGANSLSQLSVDGTSKPENCKFPCEVESVELLQVIEIIPVTEKAQKSIREVAVWKK